MQFKTILCAFAIALFSQSVFAIPFAVDNYTENTTLNYSYSFDGVDWSIPVTTIPPKGFIWLNFPTVVPLVWKLEAANGKQLHCVDSVTKRPVVNVVSLAKSQSQQREDLLLDVISTNADNEIIVNIINIDGGGPYSNILYCKVE